MKTVSIIGLGYVGLPLALLTSEKEYDVIGIDLDSDKIDKIKSGIDPIGEDYIKELLPNTSMTASTSIKDIQQSDIIIICVPTPLINGFEPDLRPLKQAANSVAKNMKKDCVVIIESTINPGVSQEVVIPILEKGSGLKINTNFHVSHCPERINPGDKKWNVSNIPRVVGSSSKTGLAITVDFYESIINAPIKSMQSLKEAEACKVVENSFRDVNIAFVNELAKSFSAMGIDVKNVIEGAATKPFAFMAHYPSVGVGGHCIPVDPYYLIEYARGYGFEHEFLSLARNINNSMPAFTIDQLAIALNEKGESINGKNILVLGISYKANVADYRQSPSYTVIDILKKRKARVTVYDPYFEESSDFTDMSKAVASADAVILASNHDEFLQFDYSGHELLAFIDGKNEIRPESLHNNTIYRGIGRA